MFGKKEKEKKVDKKQNTEKLGKMFARAIEKGCLQHLFKHQDVKKSIEFFSSLVNQRDFMQRRIDMERCESEKRFKKEKTACLERVRKGNRSLKKIIKILSSFDSRQISSLCDFIKHLSPRTDYSNLYKRMEAECNRRWGNPNYIVCNVMSGVKQELIGKRTNAHKAISRAVAKAQQEVGKRNRVSLHGVVSVKDGNHYIGFVCGGNNGHKDWEAYFKGLSTIISELKDAWIIEIKNDCPDDVHYALIGFRINKTIKEN